MSLRQFVQKVVPHPVRARARRTLHRVGWGPDSYLSKIDSVVHVGANTGQEREDYAFHDLDVLWVEPNPNVFKVLERNLEGYPKQRAVRGLVTDKAGVKCTLNIASNADGAASMAGASSILALKGHREMWPEVHYCDSIEIESVTLPSLLDRQYDALVMDTQGAELLVLKGCDSLPFKYIKTESADFELYEGYPLLSEMTAYLAERGFVEHRRRIMKTLPNVGTTYDIIFKSYH